MHFGSALEDALQKAVEQGKRKKPMSEAMRHQKTQETLVRWGVVAAAQRRFKDPAVKLRERADNA